VYEGEICNGMRQGYGNKNKYFYLFKIYLKGKFFHSEGGAYEG
jgi:hypothetical protein